MVVFTDINSDEIFILNELWNQNAEYHRAKSEYFKNQKRNVSFLDRIEVWKNCKDIKITKIEDENEIIGYCISCIEYNVGNIESIFIKENMRRNGIGKNVILKHIEWMKNSKCERINVTTVYGNEEAIEFYKKMNILPKKIVFELK